MTTLQKFIEKHYEKDVKSIDIRKQDAKIWNEITSDDISVKGKEVDLSSYTQLEFLRIDASRLTGQIRRLTLNNPELTMLIIVNNTGLEVLDISGCPKLKTLKLNHHGANFLPYIFQHSKTKIVGWENTKLWDEAEHDKLKNILKVRIETEGEESWEHEAFFSSSSDEDDNQEELIVELPPKKNNCNIL